MVLVTGGMGVVGAEASRRFVLEGHPSGIFARHHAIASDQDAIQVMGDEFKSGMVFAFNIDLFDPKWMDGKTGCVFAETIAITETGARRLHTYPTQFQYVQ